MKLEYTGGSVFSTSNFHPSAQFVVDEIDEFRGPFVSGLRTLGLRGQKQQFSRDQTRRRVGGDKKRA